MIRGYLRDIEELEHRIERLERRDMEELLARRRHELILKRFNFLTKLMKRQSMHEDDTYAQRARRWNYQDLIDEQKEKMKEDRGKFRDGFDLTIGDVANRRTR